MAMFVDAGGGGGSCGRAMVGGEDAGGSVGRGMFGGGTGGGSAIAGILRLGATNFGSNAAGRCSLKALDDGC
jgi:hypothetical protein